jgi:segregation and condensation protein A
MVGTPGEAIDESQLDLFTGHRVTIAIFEGPLDLLLYLVRKHEVDIYEVPLAGITEEYLAYLSALQQLSVELAGEFLVVASTLLLIKSRMLLPLQDTAEDEEEEELDPEQELAHRLLEYRAYKEASELLEESRRLRERIYLRPGEDEADMGTGWVLLEEVSVFDLVGAFRDLLEQATEPESRTVVREEMTVGSQIGHILRVLSSASENGLTFAETLVGPITKIAVIVTFLAVLELIRRRRIRVRQDPDREIRIYPPA